MKKMKFKKYNNGFSFRVGGVNGDPLMIDVRYFNKKGFRFIISLNTDRLIKLFGFNQKVIGA